MSGISDSLSSKSTNMTPVILTGGTGTALWPITRASRPKPFVKFFSRNSLFQDTLQRVSHLNPPVVVCASSFASTVFQECYEVGVKPRAIICEPAQRNTTAAISAAAFVLKDDHAKILVMPSDHFVRDVTVFRKVLVKAAAMEQEFALIGAKPRDASTRYGYIQHDEDWGLVKFFEKPTIEMARVLVGSRQALWSTGMFMCKPSVFLTKLEQFQPDIFRLVKVAYEAGGDEEPFYFPDFDAYAGIPPVSVDYAVMEKLGRAGVVPLATTWHDMGTLTSFFRAKFLS